MRSIAKTIILWPLYILDRILLLFGVRDRALPVLMYHSVSNQEWSFAVSPSAFEEQLLFLVRNGYQFCTAEQIKGFIQGTWTPGQKSIALTFDDGYRDYLTSVLPLLKKYQAHALLFPHTSRDNTHLGNQIPLLTWDDLKEVAGTSQTEIGSHATTHNELKHMSAFQLEEELAMSENALTQHLGKRPTIFAYPGGKYTAFVVEKVREHAYQLAFSVNQGRVHSLSDPLLLPRINMGRLTTLTDLRISLSRAIDWYAALRRLWINK